MSSRFQSLAVVVTTASALSFLSVCSPVAPTNHEADTTVTRGAQDAKPNLDRLTRLCWVAYSPTHFDPAANPVRWPTEQDISEDLRVLRRAGFNGLVTYGSNYADQSAPNRLIDIAGVAEAAGFEGVIVGVWDPISEQELQAAERASTRSVVAGYCVGNEGLDARYDLKTLTSAMERLRRTTGKPVSTSEEVGDYVENSPLWNIGDWTFPNAHPYFAKLRDPRAAVKWTEQLFDTLRPVSSKPLIFKEVGLPSGGDLSVSETLQAEYYDLLRKTNVIYVVFEAFDSPWKHLGRPKPDGTYARPDPEPHWGIFKSNRKPKEVAANVCRSR